MSTKWKLVGNATETCNCEVACPCAFLSAPTQGNCKSLMAFHIDQGNFGDLTLDGFNVILAAYVPGHFTAGNWKVALYLDDRASQTQQEALTKIFAGQVGGTFANLAPLIGEVLGVKSVPIEYRLEGKQRSFKISNIVEAEVEVLPGFDGGEITLTNSPFALDMSAPTVIGKSKRAMYNDHGLSWEHSGKSAQFQPFSYQGE